MDDKADRQACRRCQRLPRAAELVPHIDRNWELLAPFAGAQIACPALYVAGDQDLVVHFPGMDQIIANLSRSVPWLTRTVMLPGCGHWTQQERAPEVNAALIGFLRGPEA